MLVIRIAACVKLITDVYAFTFTVCSIAVAPETILPINDMTDEMRTHHMLSDEGVKACHRVLYVISETHPQIQQVNMIESMSAPRHHIATIAVNITLPPPQSNVT